MKITISLIAVLLAAGLQAQTLKINAGGSAVAGFVSDQGFIGGGAYGPASQADPGWKAQTGIYATLRYGTAFSYDFAVPNGSCAVQLHLIENRPAVATASVPAAAIGARVFTVTVNGTSTGPIDIFAAAGAQAPYNPPAITALVTTGHLRLDFKATAGNAVVSAIEASCTGPVISLTKCAKPPVPTTTVMNADGTTTTINGSDCAGLFYHVEIVTPAGTILDLIAEPVSTLVPPHTFVAPDWSLVP